MSEIIMPPESPLEIKKKAEETRQEEKKRYKIKFYPTGRNLYVELGRVEEEVTDGGIILPDKHAITTRIGKIIEVGPKVEDKRLKKDVLILIEFVAGTAIHIPKIKFLDDTRRIIAESEIITIIEEEPIEEE